MTDLQPILQVIEILSILGGGGLVAVRLGKTQGAVTEGMKIQAKEITALQVDIKTLNKLVTEVAVQTTRLDMLEKRYEELRHGEGFVSDFASRVGTFIARTK